MSMLDCRFRMKVIMSEQRTTSMRVTPEVTEQARIAAALKGVSMMEYVRQVVLAAAARDIEEFRRGGAPPPAKPKRSKSS
jgi:uncharacterized protein (DUF1778 family)